GVTGWAVTHGRNTTTWEERLQQDVWYIDHRSFALDCWILLLTVVKVIKQEDISPKGRVTMPRFDEEVSKKI
ncbi:MAG: sugar transferase, partial [Geminicoccaceae bacterium]